MRQRNGRGHLSRSTQSHRAALRDPQTRTANTANTAEPTFSTIAQPASDPIEPADVPVLAKPLLRGWLHLVLAPVALIACMVMFILAPTAAGKVGAAVLGFTATMLFGTSALYHRRYWSPRADAMLRRWDHANIYLIIAGTYTPFALTLLEGRARVELLLIVWVGALLGIAFRVFWLGAPRWLYTPIYAALGWVAVFYFEPLHAAGGTLIVVLMALGGVLYTLGAVVYGLKRPDPWPRVFGFHEIFHSCTVAAFVAHCIAAYLAVLAIR